MTEYILWVASTSPKSIAVLQFIQTNGLSGAVKVVRLDSDEVRERALKAKPPITSVPTLYYFDSVGKLNIYYDPNKILQVLTMLLEALNAPPQEQVSQAPVYRDRQQQSGKVRVKGNIVDPSTEPAAHHSKKNKKKQSSKVSSKKRTVEEDDDGLSFENDNDGDEVSSSPVEDTELLDDDEQQPPPRRKGRSKSRNRADEEEEDPKKAASRKLAGLCSIGKPAKGNKTGKVNVDMVRQMQKQMEQTYKKNYGEYAPN